MSLLQLSPPHPHSFLDELLTSQAEPPGRQQVGEPRAR